MSDDASPADVGRQLAQRRDDLGLTQDQLAKCLPISARTVSAIERGVNAIQKGNRREWERVLKLKPGSIGRAYTTGAPIEVLDDADDSSGGPEPTVAELAAQVAELTAKVEAVLRRLNDQGKAS
jgi:transcriptional regulator with XRE-family HTH domain